MQELFFELLRVAVGQQECLSRGPSSEEWQAIADEARSQGVQGICYRGVEQLFDYGLRIPQDLALDWMADAEELKERNIIIKKRCATLQRKLTERGIRSTVLKGQGIALYYNDLSGLRQTDAIDLYVNCGKDRTQKFAELTGQQHVNTTRQYVAIDAWKDTPVRLYYQLPTVGNVLKKRQRQLWLHRNWELLFEQNDVLIMPSATMNTVYMLLELFRQFLHRTMNMQTVVDYFFVLKKYAESNRSLEDSMTVDEVFRMLGLSRFASGVMWLMHDVFHIEKSNLPYSIDEEEGRFLLKSLMGECSVIRHYHHLTTHYPTEIL